MHFNGKWHLRDYFFNPAMSIDSYGLIPLWAIRLIAPILPWYELALGVLLIVGAGLRWAGLFASSFMIALSYPSVVAQLRNTGDGFSMRGNLVPSILIRDGSLMVLALAATVGAFLIKRRRAAVSS
jgi:MFS-type transporter involved in bile tolerance (Atg22 family)